MTDVVDIDAMVEEASGDIIGPPEVLNPQKVSKAIEAASLDKEIAMLAQAGMTYIDIATHLSKPVGWVIRRITSLINREHPALSAEHLNGYLIHSLHQLELVKASALDDMEDYASGEKVAGSNRHNGRMALLKALQHEAAIVGLMRSRIDVNVRQKVEIAVVRADDYDAL